MNKLFEIAMKVSTAWSMAAFAIAALISFGVKMKKGKVPGVAWTIVAAVVIVAIVPIIAPLYMSSYGIYRVHVTVLDENHMPTSESSVTCTGDGNVKKAEHAWECAIPAKSKPADGKIQVYAARSDAFLTGHAELELKDDYSPAATIQLGKDSSARVIGIVVDENNNPLEGAHVGVVGYDSEGVITKTGGNFSFSAHTADGQQVQLYAFKGGYVAGPPEWHQAGDHPVTIVLRRQRSMKGRGV
jgi:hypothetical protein